MFSQFDTLIICYKTGCDIMKQLEVFISVDLYAWSVRFLNSFLIQKLELYMKTY